MKNRKLEIITLKFMSYNKVKFFSKTKKNIKKKLFKDFKKILILLWTSLRPHGIFKLKFNKLKTYNKFYTLVKGPKCHKKGKHILKYTYYTYEIIITKNLKLNKSLYNLTDYFSALTDNLKLYNSNYSSNNKIILNTYINL